MATITIRMPDALKVRVTSAAEQAGKTAHSFILEAITEKAELEEQRADFVSEAESRFTKIAATGETIAWPELRRFLEANVAAQPLSAQDGKKRSG